MDDIAREYYSMAQAVKLCRLPGHTIRFYCDEFKLKIKTGRNGDRHFTDANIQKMLEIKHLLKVRLFTIQGAKNELKKHSYNDEIENVLRVL